MNENEFDNSSDAGSQSQSSTTTSNLTHDVESYEQSIMSSVSWGPLGVATESIDETVMNFQKRK